MKDNVSIGPSIRKVLTFEKVFGSKKQEIDKKKNKWEAQAEAEARKNADENSKWTVT